MGCTSYQQVRSWIYDTLCAMKKPVLVIFGGVSAEHGVSVVTGLQALEHVDPSTYEPLAIFISKTGEASVLPSLTSRKGYLKAKREAVTFGKDSTGGFVRFGALAGKKVYPHAALLCLHGGLGENGSVQGLLEACGIPYTSPNVEASAIAMNKRLTKEVLRAAGITVAPDARAFAKEIQAGSKAVTARVEAEIALPVIVKPVHAGSSIGIGIAKTSVELEKRLIEAAAMDSEVLVEPFFSPITEYNCSVRSVKGVPTASPIERPMSQDEILSFADKYERGGKKTGGGMASLSRELPAKIDAALTKQITDTALAAYTATRMKGLVRIDFMRVPDGTLYLTEINTIPGSLSFYLWEAAGVSYEELIRDLIEEAVQEAESARTKQLDYTSDIITRFVSEG